MTGARDTEERLRAALAAKADTVSRADLRWLVFPTTGRTGRRRCPPWPPP